MSAARRPSWAHPLLRAHQRYTDKRLVAAVEAADALGVALDVAAIRQALEYDRTLFPRIGARFMAAAMLFSVAVLGYERAACTPGGTFEPSADTDCSLMAYAWWQPLLAFSILAIVLFAVLWFFDAVFGQTTARSSRGLLPLLDVLACSAAAASAGAPHAAAVRLSRKVSRLRVHLQTLARFVAEEFGNRRALRSELMGHLNEVNAAFVDVAHQLAGNREASARRLGSYAAQAANNIASGRFTSVLPETVLSGHEVLVEPDRLDGRRLAVSCGWAAVLVTGTIILLSPLGVAAELVVPVALVAFIALVYVLLAVRFGLSEATRLTRSIGGFFSAGPPL